MPLAPHGAGCIIPRMMKRKRKPLTLIKQARLRAGLTQIELAGKCKCDQASISRYESGRGIPRMGTAKCLAKVLKLDLIEVLDPPRPRQQSAA